MSKEIVSKVYITFEGIDPPLDNTEMPTERGLTSLWYMWYFICEGVADFVETLWRAKIDLD